MQGKNSRVRLKTLNLPRRAAVVYLVWPRRQQPRYRGLQQTLVVGVLSPIRSDTVIKHLYKRASRLKLTFIRFCLLKSWISLISSWCCTTELSLFRQRREVSASRNFSQTWMAYSESEMIKISLSCKAWAIFRHSWIASNSALAFVCWPVHLKEWHSLLPA